MPKVMHKAAGIRKMARTSRKLASGVGFSKGWAELTLKKPPPLVPSCLMAICDAAGPTAMLCSAVVAQFGLVEFELFDELDGGVLVERLHDALADQNDRQHDGQRQQDIERR